MGKKVTITTVAKEVGMSTAAVSRAFDKNSKLKLEKRELILETAKRLGYAPNKMAARLPCKPIHIGVLIYGSMEDYYNEYVRGIRQSYENFASYKVECDLRVFKKSEHPIEEAYRVIDQFINEKYDGVILSGFDYKSDLERINRLCTEKIPFIIMDHDIENCKRSGVSMNDVNTAGRLASQLLSASMRFENKNVAVLCSDPLVSSQKMLMDSFCDSAREFGFRVSYILPTYNLYQRAYEHTKEILKDPTVGGIYVSSANSAAVCECIRQMGFAKKIGLVTSDVFEELRAYIENGTVFATIYQNPARQASNAFDSLMDHILEKRKIKEFTFISPTAVLKSNLNLYL